MKFDLISDMHVDIQHGTQATGVAWYDWNREKQSDICVIAGDTANTIPRECSVMREAASIYEHVIYIDGNHSHYAGYVTGLTVSQNLEILAQTARDCGNVTLLQGTNEYRCSGTVFIGCMGWYDWTAYQFAGREEQRETWRREINDSRCIRFDPSGMPDRLAERDAARLTEQVAALQNDSDCHEIVVVTHTVPLPGLLVPDTHPWGSTNGSYCNTLMSAVWDQPHKIRVWCFGHTHISRDEFHHGIRFISNPRGYFNESRYGQPYRGLLAIDVAESQTSAFGPIEAESA